MTGSLSMSFLIPSSGFIYGGSNVLGRTPLSCAAWLMPDWRYSLRDYPELVESLAPSLGMRCLSDVGQLAGFYGDRWAICSSRPFNDCVWALRSGMLRSMRLQAIQVMVYECVEGEVAAADAGGSTDYRQVFFLISF